MYAATYRKDPDAVLDYTLDWVSWLASGEVISTSTWTVATGVTKDSDTHDDDSATIWVSGGTAGESYTLANKVVTDGGRTDERTILIQVESR